MNMSPAMESFLVGLLCGGVIGAAVVLSRRLLALAFGLGAAVLVFVLIDQGVPGLEWYGRQLILEVLQHRHLMGGAVLGVVLAAMAFDRSSKD